MAIDALLPVGGELMMVVAGAIAAGTFAGSPTLFGSTLSPGLETYVVLSVAGTSATVLGALVGWAIGERVGRDTLERHGHLVHLGSGRIDRAERWFHRYGVWAVFIGRLTPLVRSFISIPAGLFGEPLGRYMVLTTIASAIWCFGFAGLGMGAGRELRLGRPGDPRGQGPHRRGDRRARGRRPAPPDGGAGDA